MQKEKVYSSKINGRLVGVKKVNNVYIVNDCGNNSGPMYYCPIIFNELYEKVESGNADIDCAICETWNCEYCIPGTFCSTYKKPSVVQTKPEKLTTTLIFTDETKDMVFRTLSEIQNNVYQGFSLLNRPVLKIPKDGKEITILLGESIEIVDGEIVRIYHDVWKKEE